MVPRVGLFQLSGLSFRQRSPASFRLLCGAYESSSLMHYVRAFKSLPLLRSAAALQRKMNAELVRELLTAQGVLTASPFASMYVLTYVACLL